MTGTGRFRAASRALVLVLVVEVAALCACSRRATPSVLPGHETAEVTTERMGWARWALITCRQRAADCADTANLLCPGGYLVLDSSGRPTAAAGPRSPVEVRHGALRVRCVSSAIQERP